MKTARLGLVAILLAAAFASSSLAETPAAEVITRLKAIADPGGSDAWDPKAKAVLIAAYDADKSGSIDKPAEVAAISCDVLIALDKIVAPFDDNKSGLVWTYGFKAKEGGKTFHWVGGALGFDEKMRSVAFERMTACKLPASLSQR